MAAAPQRSGPDAARVAPAIARLLRPLVRLCIRGGITFPALTQLLRELYVNVAEYDFALPGKEQTDSRVSLLTGIHRKEVSRLRGAGAPVTVVPAAISLTSAVIAHWLAEPDFTDSQGHPLPLPRSGPSPSFEALVGAVTRDVRPRAVLDEWLDSGLVAVDGEDRVTLREAAFVPRGDDDKLYYFGRNLHDHVAAAVENVLAAEPRFMERAVHYDGLSEDLAKRLEARARELADAALQQANREAHTALRKDGGGEHRWILGVYVYREDASRAQPKMGNDEP
jgi:hypothetical protein